MHRYSTIRINREYDTVVLGGKTRYKHIEIWSAHHGIRLDASVFVIHHIDDDKRNNLVCDGPEPCLVLNCGNLAPLSRADHIREHRPGKMSGEKGFTDTKKRKARKVKGK